MGTKRSRADSDSPTAALLSPESPGQASKYIHVDDHLQTAVDASSSTIMRCALPPHRQPLNFPTYEAYEVHYVKAHANRCAECGRNFPTEHLLGLHIAENHDPLNDARKANGEKIYACLVEDCDRVCSTPQKRRLHLIDKHMYPRDYDFRMVDHGIDQRRSMLRSPGHRRRSSATFVTTHRDRDRRERRRSGATEPHSNGVTTTDGASIHSTTHPTGNPPSSMFPSAELTTGLRATSNEAPNDHDPVRATKADDLRPDQSLSDLTISLAALKFVPPSVRLGRGKQPG